MPQATVCDGVAFDALTFEQDCLGSAKVDVSGRSEIMERCQSVAEKARVRSTSAKLKPGVERDRLLKKVSQLETASHLNEWLTSPGCSLPKKSEQQDTLPSGKRAALRPRVTSGTSCPYSHVGIRCKLGSPHSAQSGWGRFWFDVATRAS